VSESGVQPDVFAVDTVTCPSSDVAAIEEAPYVQAVGVGAFVAFELPTETQMARTSAKAVAAPNLVPCFRFLLDGIDRWSNARIRALFASRNDFHLLWTHFLRAGFW
jgi:hypothetical protein